MKKIKSSKKNSELKKEILLAQLLPYVRIIAASLVSDAAKKVIDSYQKAQVYNSLNGTTSDEEISKAIGVPRRTITSWADSFVKNRLAVREDRKEKALFSLEELGIDINTLKKLEEKQRVIKTKTQIEETNVINQSCTKETKI